MSHYLSMKIDNDIKNKTITLHQFTYLKKILDRYNMKGATLLKISMSSEVLNSLESNSGQASKKIIT